MPRIIIEAAVRSSMAAGKAIRRAAGTMRNSA